MVVNLPSHWALQLKFICIVFAYTCLWREEPEQSISLLLDMQEFDLTPTRVPYEGLEETLLCFLAGRPEVLWKAEL